MLVVRGRVHGGWFCWSCVAECMVAGNSGFVGRAWWSAWWLVVLVSTELARDCLQKNSLFSVVRGIISPVHNAYGKKVYLIANSRVYDGFMRR